MRITPIHLLREMLVVETRPSGREMSVQVISRARRDRLKIVLAEERQRAEATARPTRFVAAQLKDLKLQRCVYSTVVISRVRAR